MAQMNINPNEDTEFHDALRARGIIPQKPPSRSPSPDLPTESEQKRSKIQNSSLDQINRALEVDGRNSLGEEEEKLLLRIKEQRLKNIKREDKRNRFGRVYPIGRPDYTREVTEASKENPDKSDDEEEEEDEDEAVETGAGSFGRKDKDGKEKGKNKGTGVVCYLYKDGMETCQLLSGYLDTLAAKYRSTKFVSIVGDKCIPNYPDKNLPTMLIYRNGELHRQIVGLRPEIGLDGMKTTLGDIELLLTAVGVLDPSTVPGSSTHPNQKDAATEEAERAEAAGEDEDEGFGGNRNGAAARGSKIRGPTVKTQEEEDAELDWDL